MPMGHMNVGGATGSAERPIAHSGDHESVRGTDKQKGDAEHTLADLLAGVCGHRPEVSIEGGLGRFFEWHLDNRT